jgi:hypothetical protein
MDTQTLVVAALVAGAALYLLAKWRRVWAASRPSKGPGCGGDCCGR